MKTNAARTLMAQAPLTPRRASRAGRTRLRRARQSAPLASLAVIAQVLAKNGAALATLLCVVALLGGCKKKDKAGTCDPSAPTCPEGQICLADDSSEKGGTCTEPCDPLATGACSGGQSCERVEDDGDLVGFACFDPVVMSGQVFDASDLEGIPGAQVSAADHTGAAVTDVVLTDAGGNYELTLPVARDRHGAPIAGIFTLRVAAADYLPYPYGIRPAIPVDASTASAGDGRWSLANPSTDVALLPLPADERGQGSIAGTVRGDLPGGTLVVAECGAPPCPFSFADLHGDYRIFNVPAGDYTVTGYKADSPLVPVSITLGAGEHRTGVDLAVSDAALGSVSGTVNIVNPGDGSTTSVVLVPESLFQQISDTFVRGEVPPGLRAPEPGVAPNVSNQFSIPNVPPGAYVALAAFENDFLVRDPDPSIAGTQIVHLVVGGAAGLDITLSSSFKVTGALTMIAPGADGPQEVDPASITFIWKDDSSEDFYTITVYNAFGHVVWHDPSVPRVTGAANVEVTYTGPDLVPGMYYQWRAESWRNTGPISSTEELRGVFYIPALVQ